MLTFLRLGLVTVLVSTSVSAQDTPMLTMNAAQRQAVRVVAARYAPLSVEVVVEPDAPRVYQSFARAFTEALRAAGLEATHLIEATDRDCATRAGLRVAYSPELSGAANAIAEALMRSKALSDSLAGCSIGGVGRLRFLVAGQP